MKFKDTLKQLRNDNNLSQKDLADALGTTAKTVSHWETGYTEPSIAQIVAIARYFEISIDELLGNQ